MFYIGSESSSPVANRKYQIVYNMAAPLTGKSWRDFLDKNKQLPPAFDREHAAHDISTPICINIKSLTGLINQVRCIEYVLIF